MSEHYYTSIDKYNTKYHNNTGHIFSILPEDFWGHGGYTAYELKPGYTKYVDTGDDPTFTIYLSLTPAEGVKTNDYLEGDNNKNAEDKPNDQFFGGLGNDYLSGLKGDDQLIGGDGNDELHGGDHGDVLLGDWTNYPTVNSSTSWSIPDEDTSIAGNDTLLGESGNDTIVGGPGDDTIDGGDGADIIDAGPGNDSINAGPRGDGYLDDITGGPGADMFLLSYAKSGDADDPSASFWSAFTEDAVSSAARAGVEAAITALGKAAFKSATSSILFGPLGAAGGELAKAGIEALFNMAKSKPPAVPEDVMVIRDFDPREDVLFLPIDASKTLTSEVKHFDNSAANGNTSDYIHLDNNLSGYAISFESGGDNQYAQVFLAKDYLKALGISDKTAEATASLQNILNTAVFIGANGLTDPNSAYAFSTIKPEDRPDWAAPSGTKTEVFGALGPMVIIGGDQTGLNLAGTNFGDVITANAKLLPPDEVAGSFDVTTNNSQLHGFGGNDFLYGGNGRDDLFGGDGNNSLYGFDVTVVTTFQLYNALHGDGGDDVLYGGAGPSALDGGDGSHDTVSYELSPHGVTVDLGTAPDLSGPHSFAGIATDFPGVTFTGYATGFSTYDILANIEDVIGSRIRRPPPGIVGQEQLPSRPG